MVHSVALEVILPLPEALRYVSPAPPPAPVGLLPLPELRAFEVLAEGGTVAEAAAAAGVHRNTAARWAAPEGRVGRELAALRAEQTARARARLAALSERAVEVLCDVMTDPEASATARVRAAVAVLDRAGLGAHPEPEPAPELEPELEADPGDRLLSILARTRAALATLPDPEDEDPEDRARS
jgi:hypothetical protein